MRRLSASKIALARQCHGPFVLPVVERTHPATTRGTVIHRYVEDTFRHGRDAALADVPEEYREECAGIDLDAIATLLEGATSVHSELAFAWDPVTDMAIVLGEGGARDYSKVPEGWIAGTADIVAVYPDRIVVPDIKTGRTEVEAAASNDQLKTLAVMAARALKRSIVDVGILQLRDDGGWWRDMARLDALDLDGHAAELRGIVDAVARASEKYAATGVVDVTEGEGCRWCPSLVYCPAKTRLALALQGEVASATDAATGLIVPSRLTAKIAVMSSEAAGEAWMQVGYMQQVVDRLRQAIEDRAKVEEIPLPDGTVLKEVTESREYVSGPVVYAVVKELISEDAAASVCETTIKSSKSALTKVLGKDAKRVLEVLRQRNGVRTTTSTRVQPVKKAATR